MIRADLAILIVFLVVNALLGLLVISRDSKSLTNRLFLLFVVAMSSWTSANYLSYRNIHTLFYTRLVLCFAVLFAMSFLVFALNFPSKDNRIKLRRYYLLVFWTVLVMALTLTPLVFKTILVSHGSNVGKPVVGPGIAVFGLTVAIFDIGALYILARKTIKSRGEERLRRLYLFIGMIIMIALILGLNFILPAFFAKTQFIPYAPLFILPFLGFTVYAVIRHHLLDIRTAAARALAYVLSLGSIALVYGAVLFILSGLISNQSVSQTSQRIIYISVALFLALLFQSTKKFFDNLTIRIFFKGAYDSQEVINSINEVLVNNIDTKLIINKTSRLLSNTLAVAGVNFLQDTNDNVRILGTSDTSYKREDIDELLLTVKRYNRKIINVNQLIGEQITDGYEIMVKHNIGVVAEIITNKQHIGYLLVGIKKSGNAYTEQDLTIIEIITAQLAIALQNALRFDQIEHFNVTLQGRVDDATRALQRANDKLKALDEAKDDFISMASHQLRTPLTSVKGYLSLVLDGDTGVVGKKQKDMLSQAFTSSQRMAYLISDLLNVSRLRTGKFVIEPTPVNLADVIQEELSQLKETVANKKLDLIYAKPKSFPSLMLDDTKTRQVIMNFIDNAIYYTPSEGKIEIKLINNPETIEMRVIDSGIGVAKADRHHLFTKFFRAGNARQARPDGTGLGLFMAKKVILAEGGAIIFDSEVGKGSTFGFTFSKSKLGPPKGKIAVKTPSETPIIAK